MKFFYQISGKSKDSYHESWSPLWKGIVEANDKKLAKKMVNELFDEDLKEKISKKNQDAHLKIFIIDLTPKWEEYWLSIRSCEVCSESYNIMDSYHAGFDASPRCCSRGCHAVHRKKFVPEFIGDGYKSAKPVIYRILNRSTGKSYVGKTIRPFTLRWWEHFYHPSFTPFHEEIKSSPLTVWSFEVVEIFTGEAPSHSFVLEREQFWIDQFDSIKNGYNTATAKAQDELDQKAAKDQMALFIDESL